MAKKTVKTIQDKLVDAVIDNNVTLINELIEQGADVNCPNKHGMTPLVIAASYRTVEALEALLKAGADPNKGIHTYVDYGYKLPSYETPLHIADWETDSTVPEIASKAKRMVELLKKFGATE